MPFKLWLTALEMMGYAPPLLPHLYAKGIVVASCHHFHVFVLAHITHERGSLLQLQRHALRAREHLCTNEKYAMRTRVPLWLLWLGQVSSIGAAICIGL